MLFALCLTSFQAHAQRYLPGMKGLQVTAGMADGVHWNSDTDFAYHIGAAYSIYTKNANRWVIAALCGELFDWYSHILVVILLV